jgi:tRNA wybutosine-synthesizing protein 3
MITFKRRKEDVLGKEDKSSIGEIDEKIKKLCDIINKKEEYYTLSSCSGRIVLIRNIDKKKPGLFFFVSHDKIKLPELKKQLDNAEKKKESLIFKQESFILHVACKTLEDADVFLKKVQEIGMKHSGIINIGEKRIIIEVIESSQLAFPITERGKILVNDDFLKILVSESDKRLEKSWEKIEKLGKIL